MAGSNGETTSTDRIMSALESQIPTESDTTSAASTDSIMLGLEANDNPANHFIGGFDKVTGAFASPFEKIFGTVRIGGDPAFEYLSPDEVSQAREDKTIGIPGRATTETLASLPLIARGMAAIPATTATGALPAVQRFVGNAGRSMLANPAKTAAVETGLGFTAGATGYVAQQKFPNSAAAGFIGEVVGGTTPQMMPARILLNGGRYLKNLVTKPFTKQGGDKRAVDRMARGLVDGNSDKAVAGLDAETTIDPKTGQPVLSPAARSDEVGLMSLENDILKQSEDLVHVKDKYIANVNEVLEQQLNDIGGDPNAPMPKFEEYQEYTRTLMQAKVRQSAEMVDQRVAALGDSSTVEAANRIAREELDDLVLSFKNQEDEIWALVPKGVVVPTKGSSTALAEHILEEGAAGAHKIPTYAKKFLSPTKIVKGKKVPNPDFLGEGTSIGQLRIVQKELREKAWNWRGGNKPKLEKARIADLIADSIDVDLGNAVSGPESLASIRAAKDFSNLKHQLITQTSIGQTTRRGVRGGDAIDPSLTLTSTMGVSGEKGRVAYDQMIKAFDENVEKGNTTFLVATEDFIRGKFAKAATTGGQVEQARAATWLRNHDEILQRMPELKGELEQVVKEGGDLSRLQNRAGNAKFDDPNISKATMYIQRGPNETFKSIANMPPVKAHREVQKLINMAAKDESGEALEGLKSGFVQYIMKGSQSSARDINDTLIHSGFKMKEMLANPSIKRAINKLLSPEEANRLKVIANDFSRLEKSMAAGASREGVLGDKPAKMLNAIAGIAGAQTGTRISKITGGGNIQTAGIMAQRVRDMVAHKIADPATRLMTAAIFDERIFRDVLLAPLRTDGTMAPKAAKVFSAWAATVLAERGGMFGDEEQ